VDGFRTDKKIKIVWAKPYPLCFFSAEELKLILRLSTVKNICEIHHNRFTNNLCITPAAYAIPCMALDTPKYRIRNLSSLENLAQASKIKVEKLIRKGFSENCGACILYQMGSCQAACYTYVG
jgi:radical SAM protein with 4Fe4S-binding SPASM domain